MDMKQLKKRNPLAKTVRDPNGPFAQRVVETKRKYNRKNKHGERHDISVY